MIISINRINITTMEGSCGLFVPNKSADKGARYQNVRKALEARLDASSHPLANTSNLLAILREEFGWWWIGYYWVREGNTPNEHLALGQFQGPPACTKLVKGTGVCAHVWVNNKPIVLEDVHTF
jgi:L-methionine (R)-S-oxide reductase